MSEEKKDSLPAPLVCEDCGKSGPDVAETFCPYSEEINDEEITVVLCSECYDERLYAI